MPDQGRQLLTGNRQKRSQRNGRFPRKPCLAVDWNQTNSNVRVPYQPSGTQTTQNDLVKHAQHSGELSGWQSGTKFFGNFWSGVKKFAIPVLKSVAKEALPMATQALSTGLGAKGGVKAKLNKAAGQSAFRKNNLLKLGKAATGPVF